MRYDKLLCVILHGYLWTEVWGSYIVLAYAKYVTGKNIRQVVLHCSSTNMLHPLYNYR